MFNSCLVKAKKIFSKLYTQPYGLFTKAKQKCPHIKTIKKSKISKSLNKVDRFF